MLRHATEWLENHPISNENDILFIKHVIAECIHMPERAGEDAVWGWFEIIEKGVNWIGEFFMLQLIHILIYHDERKRAFHDQHDLPNRCMVLEVASVCWQINGMIHSSFLFQCQYQISVCTSPCPFQYHINC
jgi:hypothetical protein